MTKKLTKQGSGGVKKSKTTRDKAHRKRLEKELDDLFSKIVHKSWGYKCAWPGCKNVGTAAHHYFHKAQGLIARWSLENGILLDYGHHFFQVHSKGDTEPIRDKIIEKIGIDAFMKLKSDVRKTWKPTLEDLEDLKHKWTILYQSVKLEK